MNEKHFEQLVFTVVLYLIVALFKWDIGWFFELSPAMMLICGFGAPVLYHAAMNNQR
jgi:hypothetical protein